jgi:hypothetical protein
MLTARWRNDRGVRSSSNRSLRLGHLSKARWFSPIRRCYNALCRARLAHSRVSTEAESASTKRLLAPKPTVLVLGIYLADRSNTASHLVRRFSESRHYSITQAWVAINGSAADANLWAATVEHVQGFVPKFCILNRLLSARDWRTFDYLVVVDDDIVLPAGFVDAFLNLQIEFDFALAQPARTRNSYADRKFCRQRRGMRGRQTRFVEIGPLFSMRRDFALAVLPFDETSGMGWGYDFVWPVVAEQARLKIGIIDATPVDHSLRDQASAYSGSAAAAAMEAYLQNNRHLSKQEAFTIVETF